MQKLQDLIDKFGFYTKGAENINKDALIKFGIFVNNNDKDIISDFINSQEKIIYGKDNNKYTLKEYIDKYKHLFIFPSAEYSIKDTICGKFFDAFAKELDKTPDNDKLNTIDYIISDFNYLTESLEDINLNFLNKINNKTLIPDFFDADNPFIKGLLDQGYLTECLKNINLTNKLFDKIKEFKLSN